MSNEAMPNLKIKKNSEVAVAFARWIRENGWLAATEYYYKGYPYIWKSEKDLYKMFEIETAKATNS